MNVTLNGAPSVLPGRGGGLGVKSRADRTLETLSRTLELPQNVVDRRREGEGTLLQLQAAQRSMVSDRKAAAKQKLDQAKARLQMLRMFAGDPKAMARQAREIAREIREAARAYGAAGATGQPAAETSPNSKASGSQEGGTGTAAGPEGSTGETRQPTAEEERQKAAEAYRATANDIASRGARSQAEREEIEQFKDAARQARQLLAEAARRLRQEQADPAETEEIEKASRSMTRAVEDLSAPDATGAVAGTMPVLDVLA